MNSFEKFSKIYNSIISEARVDYKKYLTQDNPSALNSFMKSEIGLGKLIREKCSSSTPKFKKSSPSLIF